MRSSTDSRARRPGSAESFTRLIEFGEQPFAFAVRERFELTCERFENGVAQVGFLYGRGPADTELGGLLHKAVWERCKGEYVVASDPKAAEQARGIAVWLQVLCGTTNPDIPPAAAKDARRLSAGQFIMLAPPARDGRTNRIWIIGPDKEGCAKGIMTFARMLRREAELPATASQCK